MDAENRLGEFIRERRESLGFAVGRVFAAQIEMDPTMLSRIETGRAKTLPEPGVLRKIANALGVSMSELLAAAGYADETSTDDDPTVSEIISLVRQVNWDRSEGRVDTVEDVLKGYIRRDREAG